MSMSDSGLSGWVSSAKIVLSLFVTKIIHDKISCLCCLAFSPPPHQHYKLPINKMKTAQRLGVFEAHEDNVKDQHQNLQINNKKTLQRLDVSEADEDNVKDQHQNLQINNKKTTQRLDVSEADKNNVKDQHQNLQINNNKTLQRLDVSEADKNNVKEARVRRATGRLLSGLSRSRGGEYGEDYFLLGCDLWRRRHGSCAAAV